MQFGSVAYLAFLALGVAVYFALPGPKSRTLWLLAASYAFYYSLSAAWTVVLAGITLVGYVFGLLIERNGPAEPGEGIPPKTKALLASGITLVVGTLFVFKYTAFAGSLINGALRAFGTIGSVPLVALALPVGISFWTFMSVAYLADVARGQIPAERNIVRYATFISFFPFVTAGPIGRAGQLLPQMAEKHHFSYEGMRSGLLLMLWGFFKKLVVADSLAVVVATVYSKPHAWGSQPVIIALATVAFAIQIYCDFSGYTDIARGSARLFGVDLLRNFNRPYIARSVKEFWRRWHMSLMGWFKDYIYIPLGGSRVPRWRRYLNIMTVFAISGIWHGAGLTFVAWGLLNGAYQIVGELLAPVRARVARLLHLHPGSHLRNGLQMVMTFSLVSIGWVFFRAGSLSDALYLLGKMAVPVVNSQTRRALVHLGLSRAEIFVTVLAVLVVFAAEWLSSRIDIKAWLFRQPVALRWAAYEIGILVVVLFGHYGPAFSAAAFVYQQF